MYAIKNIFLLITIIALVAISINAKKVPLLELSAGDIVNIDDFKESSIETIGNMFDGNKAAGFTETDRFASIHYTNIRKKKCSSLESLVSYSYPEIIIDDTEADPPKLFNSTDRLMYNFFGISQNYIDDEYSYGIIKLCRIIKIQNLNIRVINEKNLLIDDRTNYKLLLDETAVLRFKGNNGTYFVSSITTGDCLLQVRNCLNSI